MSDDKKPVKHHGLAQFILTIILFIISSYIFGDWTQSPLIDSLSIGAQLTHMFSGVETGNFAATEAVALSTPWLLISSFINLIVYYIIAGIIIFVFNLVFFRKEKKENKEKD